MRGCWARAICTSRLSRVTFAAVTGSDDGFSALSYMPPLRLWQAASNSARARVAHALLRRLPLFRLAACVLVARLCRTASFQDKIDRRSPESRDTVTRRFRQGKAAWHRIGHLLANYDRLRASPSYFLCNPHSSTDS